LRQPPGFRLRLNPGYANASGVRARATGMRVPAELT